MNLCLVSSDFLGHSHDYRGSGAVVKLHLPVSSYDGESSRLRHCSWSKAGMSKRQSSCVRSCASTSDIILHFVFLHIFLWFSMKYLTLPEDGIKGCLLSCLKSWLNLVQNTQHIKPANYEPNTECVRFPPLCSIGKYFG